MIMQRVEQMFSGVVVTRESSPIEQEPVVLRLIAAFGAAVGIYVHQENLTLTSIGFLALAYFAYMGYTLSLRYLVLPRLHMPLLVYGMILIDILALLGIIYVVGEVNTALTILFPVFIVYYSIHLGYAGSFTSATISSLGLTLLVVLYDPDQSSERALIIIVTMFYVVALVSGYLGQRSIKDEKEKEALQELLNIETRAQSLLDVTKTLHGSLELEEVLNTISQLSPVITGFPRCVVMLFDERSGRLVCRGSNLGPLLLGVRQLSDLIEAPDEHSLALRSLQEGKPVLVNNEDGAAATASSALTALKPLFVLAIPLLSNDRPLGAIYVFDTEPNRVVTDEDYRVSQIFGDLTAMAIGNATLYQEAQEKIAGLVGDLDTSVRRFERMREPRRSPSITVNGLRIDTAAQTVTVDHVPVDLSPTEFKLLRALAEEAGIALSQERLFRKTWGDVYKGQSNLVDVYIHRLRKKLESDASSPKRILTVRGAGYKLSE